MNRFPFFSSVFLRASTISLILSILMSASLEARTLSPLLTGRKTAERKMMEARSSVNYIPLIIKLSEPGAQLPEEVVELRRRGLLVLAYVPESLIEELAAIATVSRIEGGQVCTPDLDEARRFTGYPEISDAVGLSAIYTGKGVVVGFADTGFDPNHPAFLDPTTGKSRVSLLTDYGESPEECVRLESPEEIATWRTDDPEQWHATHVAGIMAGGYCGNPYWGIARDSEIVATTSILYDALLLAGMEDIIEYAKKVGKPAVINMSVSSCLGPHDGTSLFCQYLDELSKEATICISAGNRGEVVGVWSGLFPEDCATAAAVIDVPSWSPAKAEGYIDVWSQDASTFDFAVVVFDLDTETVVAREEFPHLSSDNPEMSFSIGSSAEALAEIGADATNSRVSNDFARYLKGAVTMVTEINPENNRFNGLVYLDVENHPEENGELSWRYIVGLEASGKKGQRIIGYTSDLLRFRDIPEYPKFSYLGADGGVNDFITADGVIGVGAMCSRNTWPLLSGEDGHGQYDVGGIAKFSSLSTGGICGKLPHTVAPGAWLISSISTPYIEAHPENIPTMCHVSSLDGKNYYWGDACGTSMSSPYVAGICALCLQADPDATPAEIKEAIIATSTAPTVDIYNPRWGRGILNSYEGLRSILAGAGVETVKEEAADMGFPPLPSPLTAESLCDFAREYSCEIFTPQGCRVNPSSLRSGVYILRCGNATVKVAF